MTKRKTPLPDRWDFDKWRNGSPLNPPRGHKIGMYWGEYLELEHDLRMVAEYLQTSMNEITELTERTEGASLEHFHMPLFSIAQDLVDNIEYVLANVRRHGKWPSPEDDWPEQRNQVAVDDFHEPEPMHAPDEQRSIDDEIPFWVLEQPRYRV